MISTTWETRIRAWKNCATAEAVANLFSCLTSQRLCSEMLLNFRLMTNQVLFSLYCINDGLKSVEILASHRAKVTRS